MVQGSLMMKDLSVTSIRAIGKHTTRLVMSFSMLRSLELQNHQQDIGNSCDVGYDVITLCADSSHVEAISIACPQLRVFQLYRAKLVTSTGLVV